MFARFVAGFLLFFLVCCFLAVPSVTNIVARAPVGTPMPSSRAPPMPDWSTAPIPTIHGHPCAFGLVCMLAASAHVDFRPWSQVRRWCAGVFAGMLGVYVCALGVSPVRT